MFRRILTVLLTLISLQAHASFKPITQWPGRFSASFAGRPRSVTDDADPSDVRGVRFALTYHPFRFIHKRLHVYFDTAYAYYRTDRSPRFRSIHIITVAPAARFYLYESRVLSPYIEASAGPSFENRTRFGGQHLGVKYTFQDRGGLGVSIGPKKQAYISVQIIHYSNADISPKNDGITAPVMLQMGAYIN